MVSYDERYAEGIRLINGMHSLAQDSEVPFAQNIARFFTPEFISISQPISKDGLWGLSNKISRGSVSLTPLFQQDADIHPYFASLVEQKSLRYEEGARSIYMPAKTLSARIGGLVLLHEGIHAYAHKKHIWRDMPGNWSHWMEEVFAFAHELAVVHTIAGESYERGVVRNSTIFKGKLESREFTGIAVPLNDVEPILSKITKEEYPDDLSLLSTVIGVGAMFHALSGGFKLNDQSLSSSADFLRWLYNGSADPVSLPMMAMPRELHCK